MVAIVLLTAIAIAWGVATTLTVSPAEAAPPALACPSNVCQTATGPVGVASGQKVRLAVNNFTGQDVFVVMAYIDAMSGAVLGQSQGTVLESSQGTSFDFAPLEFRAGRAEIIGALRVSFIRRPKTGSIGATLQVFDADTGKTMIYHPIPDMLLPSAVQRAGWTAESHNWNTTAQDWQVPSAPVTWGAAGP
jgi:hypothetical protein